MELAGNLKSSIIVIGCFHGDEPQGKYLIDKYLETNANTNLLFVPCLNKYGFENCKRTNKNGVDINRNFPTKNWGKTDYNDFYGESPPSEDETKFVIV